MEGTLKVNNVKLPGPDFCRRDGSRVLNVASRGIVYIQLFNSG